MQPLQYDLGCPAAKDNSITHAVAAPSKLDAAITMRSAEHELQNTSRELCAAASEIAAPNLQISTTVEDVKTKRISCEISLKILKVADVKTKLSCETSSKSRQVQM